MAPGPRANRSEIEDGARILCEPPVSKSAVNAPLNYVESYAMSNANTTSEGIDHTRRRFFGAAAMTIAAAQLSMVGSAEAQPSKSKLPSIKPRPNKSFGPLKQVDAGVLSVGYAEAGPADGPAVILLHGWLSVVR